MSTEDYRYTVKECEEKITHYDDLIAQFLESPTQTTIAGVFISDSGKLGYLQQERAKWERRLKKAKSAENEGRSAGQGPSIEVH